MQIIQSKLLSQFPNIKHGITTRTGGVSTGTPEGLNLGIHVGDKEQDVLENRKRLADFLRINQERLVFADQTHSSNIAVVDNLKSEYKDTDALVTQQPGICINTLTADCVPIIIYDPVQHVGATVHAGWKGTVKGILTKTIQLMRDKFQSNTSELHLVIGPSICQDVYEVGQEVVDEITAKCGEAFIITNSENKKGYPDLQRINKQQALDLGVDKAHVEVINICTFTDERFFSARKEGFSTGRFSSFIMLSE